MALSIWKFWFGGQSGELTLDSKHAAGGQVSDHGLETRSKASGSDSEPQRLLKVEYGESCTGKRLQIQLI